MDCISLPVDNLQETVAFYRDGLGWTIDPVDGDSDHLPLQLPNGSYLIFILRQQFSEFTAMARLGTAPKGAAECILSYFASGKDEVDDILRRAAATGAQVTEAEDRSWGYAGFFTDPDQHFWEVVWMPSMSPPQQS
jgi:predicted lactoylglutathione lyase